MENVSYSISVPVYTLQLLQQQLQLPQQQLQLLQRRLYVQKINIGAMHIVAVYCHTTIAVKRQTTL